MFRNSKTCVFAVLIVMLISAVSLLAQVPTPPPLNTEDEIVRIDTQLIDVPVSVTDKDGKPILKLTKDNFRILEDGKEQAVESFFSTDEPFEVALLLDTSGSTRAELGLITRAAQMFVDSLRDGDRVAIIAFNTGEEKNSGGVALRTFPLSEVIVPLTADRKLLAQGLAKVGTSNGTPYYDGLLQVAEKVFKNPPEERFRGRRALVALTDGVDSTSDAGFAEAADLITEAGLSTYFIQIDTRFEFEESLLGDCESSTQFSKAQLRRYYNLFPKEFNIQRETNFCKLGDFERLDISKRLYALADDELKALAKATGGIVFPVADLSEARRAFRKVAAEIGTSYSLGYYSTNSKQDGTYRKISVVPKGLPDGAVLRAREGYTAGGSKK